MVELMNLMELIKLVDWGSKVSALEGGEGSTSLHRNLNSFLHDLFCTWKMGSCGPKDTAPVHAPSFSSVLQFYVLLVNKVDKGMD